MDLDNLIASNEEKKESTVEINLVQIYYQKRNMRKGWTFVVGVNANKDLLTKMQKQFSCSVSLEKNGNIKMSGTHRQELIDFLRDELGIEEVKVL